MFRRAVQLQKPRKAQGPSEGFPLPEDELSRAEPVQLETAVDADHIPRKNLIRAQQLVEQGLYSKAMAALSASKVADVCEENAEKLRALHPNAPLPDRTNLPPTADGCGHAPTFSAREVRGSLRSFNKGAAGGLSALTPGHLLAACTSSSGAALGAITVLVNTVAGGKLPAEALEYFFGARLVGLEKVCGGLRPVAAGDVFRRMTGRLLATSKPAKDMEKILKANRQVGVRLSAGADALQLTAREVAKILAPDEVIMLLDYKNAFNTVSRQAFLDRIAKHGQGLLPYAQAAYAGHTRLMFGNIAICSAAGAQQGDPLGPLFFSMAAIDVREGAYAHAAAHGHPGLEDKVLFEGAFLDDTSFGAHAAQARALLDGFTAAAKTRGLELNLAKTEVVFSPFATAATKALFADVGKRSEATNFKLLGGPCGSCANAAAKVVEEKCESQKRRVGLIDKIEHPQHALALVRYCTGQSLGNHLARAVGHVGAKGFAILDLATRTALHRIVPLDWEGRATATRLEVQLPPRLGGLGLRSTVAVAPLAFAAASVAAREHRTLLVPPSSRARLQGDPLMDRALPGKGMLVFEVAPEAADAATAYYNGTKAAPQQQKKLTHMLDDALGKSVINSLAADDWQSRVRVLGNRAPASHAWISPLPGIEEPTWLAPRHFTTLMKMRYGQKLLDGDARCNRCGAMTDPYGRHTLGCGNRHSMHNVIKGQMHHFAQLARLFPKNEPMVHPGKAGAGWRADIATTAVGATSRNLLDASFVSAYAQVHRREAQSAIGGAAQHGAEEKKAKYAGYQLANGDTFTPLVVDSNFAVDADGLKWLKEMAGLIGTQQDIARSRCTQIVLYRFMTAVAAEMAEMVLGGIGQLDESDFAATPIPAGPVQPVAGLTVYQSKYPASHLAGSMIAAAVDCHNPLPEPEAIPDARPARKAADASAAAAAARAKATTSSATPPRQTPSAVGQEVPPTAPAVPGATASPTGPPAPRATPPTNTPAPASAPPAGGEQPNSSPASSLGPTVRRAESAAAPPAAGMPPSSSSGSSLGLSNLRVGSSSAGGRASAAVSGGSGSVGSIGMDALRLSSTSLPRAASAAGADASSASLGAAAVEALSHSSTLDLSALALGSSPAQTQSAAHPAEDGRAGPEPRSTPSPSPTTGSATGASSEHDSSSLSSSSDESSRSSSESSSLSSSLSSSSSSSSSVSSVSSSDTPEWARALLDGSFLDSSTSGSLAEAEPQAAPPTSSMTVARDEDIVYEAYCEAVDMPCGAGLFEAVAEQRRVSAAHEAAGEGSEQTPNFNGFFSADRADSTPEYVAPASPATFPSPPPGSGPSLPSVSTLSPSPDQRPPSPPSRAGRPCHPPTLQPAVVPKDPSPSSTAVAAASTARPETATPTSCAPPTPRGSAASAFAPAAAARLGGTNPAAPPACTTQRPPSSPSRAGHPCPFSTLHPAVVPKDPSPSSTAAVAAASTAPPEAAANHTPESTPGPTPGNGLTPTSCAPPTLRGSTAAPASVTTAEPSSSTPRARAPAAATSAFAPAAAARLGGPNPAAPPACTTQRPPSSPSRAGHPCPFSTLHPAVVPKDPSPSSTAAVAAASTAPPEAAANHTPESTLDPPPPAAFRGLSTASTPRAPPTLRGSAAAPSSATTVGPSASEPRACAPAAAPVTPGPAAAKLGSTVPASAGPGPAVEYVNSDSPPNRAGANNRTHPSARPPASLSFVKLSPPESPAAAAAPAAASTPSKVVTGSVGHGNRRQRNSRGAATPWSTTAPQRRRDVPHRSTQPNSAASADPPRTVPVVNATAAAAPQRPSMASAPPPPPPPPHHPMQHQMPTTTTNR